MHERRALLCIPVHEGRGPMTVGCGRGCGPRRYRYSRHLYAQKHMRLACSSPVSPSEAVSRNLRVAGRAASDQRAEAGAAAGPRLKASQTARACCSSTDGKMGDDGCWVRVDHCRADPALSLQAYETPAVPSDSGILLQKAHAHVGEISLKTLTVTPRVHTHVGQLL